MSSKRAKVWAITTRLTVLYTISSFALFSLTTVFLYRFLVSNLHQEDLRFLEDKVQVLKAILRERPNEVEPLEEEVQWEGSARQSSKYFSRILDQEGRLLMETSGMSQIVNRSIFPAGRETPKKMKWRSPDGKSYLLTAAWAVMGSSGEDRRLLQVALDISREESLISNYRRNLAGVLFLGILLSGVTGAIIARRGIRPLNKIALVTQRITASQLHQRIGLEPWPKELTALATAFDQMLDRLEDSFKRLSQFSADLAHELRTPINNLVGEAEVALSRSRTPEEYCQVLASGLEEYERISQMIKNLLFLARSDSSELKIDKSFFEARKEIEAVIEFHEAVAEEQKIKVICLGGATIYADSHLFRRAVNNLLSNALQYTPAGGTIEVAIEAADRQDIEIRVQDSGTGIEFKDLPKIFDRFYRGDPSRSKAREGTGLGLAIVKSIMDLHGGNVVVESNSSAQGTTAILTFPSPA